MDLISELSQNIDSGSQTEQNLNRNRFNSTTRSLFFNRLWQNRAVAGPLGSPPEFSCSGLLEQLNILRNFLLSGVSSSSEDPEPQMNGRKCCLLTFSSHKDALPPSSAVLIRGNRTHRGAAEKHEGPGSAYASGIQLCLHNFCSQLSCIYQ
ncbi:hypothetical protein XENOCAPTIV_027626 [Xenoophorus captivus]|uniref:Uncharacterized protein n=1 Tax=Xenoophorus captivus TaxID=1517983 RepID=A0ABV0RJQ7_9TELE